MKPLTLPSFLPWRKDVSLTDGWKISDCSGFVIAKQVQHHAAVEGENENNGNLLLASPDLLQALQAIDAAYEKTSRHPIATELLSAIMQARATLAKLGATNPTLNA